MLRVGLTGGIGADTSGVAGRLVGRGAILLDNGMYPSGSGTEPDGAILVQDVPLLVEKGLVGSFHLVLVVHEREDRRVRRLMAALGVDAAKARSRLRAQADDEARRAAADVWIDNTGASDGVEWLVDELWDARLAPFATNLRTATRAPRRMKAVILDPDPAWAVQAQRLIARFAAAVCTPVLRIDHIGSTSVPGLPATDVIDVQVVVPDLRVADRVVQESRAGGFVPVAGQVFGDDRHGGKHREQVAVAADPGRPVNIHVRPVTGPVWREVLLFRDWLRAVPAARAQYAAVKRELATRPGRDVNEYSEDRMPWIRAGLAQAEQWAARSGWTP